MTDFAAEFFLVERTNEITSKSDQAGFSNNATLSRGSDRPRWSSSSGFAHLSNLSAPTLLSSFSKESSESGIARPTAVSLGTDGSRLSGLSHDSNDTFQSRTTNFTLLTNRTTLSIGTRRTKSSRESCGTLHSRAANRSSCTYIIS